MKLSENQKMDILVSSFDELKDDLESSRSTLTEIIRRMFAIDENIAISMWIYLLDHQSQVKHSRFMSRCLFACPAWG